MTDDKASLPPGMARAWGVASPGRRGRKPAHSVEEIVRAAIDLADAEGLAVVSLPRLAARIGVTTNALYRYIDSKDELLVLVRDAAWGEPPARIRRAANWREGATAWTDAVIDQYRARPWLLEIPVPGSPMTPNLLGWLESLLEALDDTGLPGQDRLRCALLLDGYAYSTASLYNKIQAAAADPVQSAAAFAFLLPRLRTSGFPILASMLSNGDYGASANVTPGAVSFGLQRILDGIDALLTSVRGHQPLAADPGAPDGR